MCGYAHLKILQAWVEGGGGAAADVASFYCFFLSFHFDFQVDMPFPFPSTSPSAVKRISRLGGIESSSSKIIGGRRGRSSKSAQQPLSLSLSSLSLSHIFNLLWTQRSVAVRPHRQLLTYVYWFRRVRVCLCVCVRKRFAKQVMRRRRRCVSRLLLPLHAFAFAQTSKVNQRLKRNNRVRCVQHSSPSSSLSSSSFCLHILFLFAFAYFIDEQCAWSSLRFFFFFFLFCNLSINW